jgi:sugar lactone lactonase YvrE
MSGGVQYTHIDDDPLFTGTHDGADSANDLQDMGARFESLGATVGVYCENATQDSGGAITAVTDDTVTVDGVTWDNGDTYNIYVTDTKNSTIATTWTDKSRGWKADPRELKDGWFPDDVDLDDHGKKKVFGPGQPGSN